MISPATARPTWLVIGGPLSGYTFDLFRTVRDQSGIETRFIHAPLDDASSYGHERFRDSSFADLRWPTASVRQIDAFIREVEPQAVLLYGTQPHVPIALAILRLARSIPFVFVSDINIGRLVRERGLFARRIAYKVLFERVDAALSLGYTNGTALTLLGAKRCLDIPVLTVDFGALDAALAEPGWTPPYPPSTKTTFVVVARLVPIKNLEAAIDSLGGDPELAARCRIVLAGDGPEREKLEAAARRFPQLETRFLGAVAREAVGRVLHGADALLLPSFNDQWGIVVCEALGLGVPVVASPGVGAAVSLAGETQAVVVAKGFDAPALAEAFRTFVDKKTSLRAAASQSATAIRAHYGREAVARRLVSSLAGSLRTDPREGANGIATTRNQ